MSGDEIVIAQDGKALVKLVALVKPGKKTRQFGGAEGLVLMSDDFDAPIEGNQAHPGNRGILPLFILI